MKVSEPRFLGLLGLLLLCWAIVFTDVLVMMESIWSRSDTFAHGYFILPITIWLVWRDRAYLLRCVVKPSWTVLPVFVVALLLGLLAKVSDVNVLGQIAAIASLISLLWLMLGHQITWHYKFPLLYLLFAVPMGENLIPWLQDITAYITVLLLKLHGIPVFREGLYFQIPTGLFEVAVACSGIRYLIASAAVGTLYAHLTYNRWVKQGAFILFSLCIPLLANGIRAYLIVLIAYYSDMKYATGVDHLVYGWLFFGLVILFMFYIGGKFADSVPELKPLTRKNNPEAKRASAIKQANINAGAAILILVASFVLFNSIAVVHKPNQPLLALTGEKIVESSNWGITFFDGQQRSHLITHTKIEVFRAVYGQKQDVGELVSWQNTLFGPRNWTVILDKTVEVNGHAAQFMTLRSSSGKQRAVLYWYEIGGYITSSRSWVKLLQAMAVFMMPESKAEIIALSKEDLDERQAFNFLSAFIPELDKLKL